MTKKTSTKGVTPSERSVSELYEDPERAEALLWGRRRHNRRSLLLGTASAVVGGVALHLGRGGLPFGLVPAAFAEDSATGLVLPTKDPGLKVLNDRPINAEVPAHLLDDAVTPASRMFVRNNGIPPQDVDAKSWTLDIEGEAIERAVRFTVDELKKNFKHHTYQLTLECGGNGRSEFVPGAKGNQWSTGAVSSASYTGVRLKDVLQKAGIKKNAVYVGYYGADKHLSGDPKKVVISRGVPMAKALEDETLIAFEMNGKPLPALHGFPLRLVVGGWPASTSGKWLTKLVVRDRVHDGPKMTGQSYRVPCKTVAPGTKVPDEDMCIIESMPVKSLITFPQSGVVVPAKKKVAVRGHAWAGDRAVQEVHLSTNYGATWTKVNVKKATNRLAWQHFSGTVSFDVDGYYEVWARAVDDTGVAQPMVVPGWNPRGYLNNACHRVAVRVVS